MDIERTRSTPRITWRWALAGLLTVVLIAASGVLLRQHLQEFKAFGYLGAFLISFLGSATVVACIPGVYIMLGFSTWLNPFLLGLAAGAGEALGEIVVYTAGRTGHAFFLSDRFAAAQGNEARGIYPRLQRWIHSKGSVALFLSAAVFNPFFSLVSATAGATRFPAWKFLGVVWAGKTAKWTVIALAGYAVFGQIVARATDWFS